MPRRVVDGARRDLRAPFRHYGERTLADRVDKVNRYSSGLVVHKHRKRCARAGRAHPAPADDRLPQAYIGKRYFLNGWAGYLAARTQAFYTFLKYAKVLEAQRSKDQSRRATCRRVAA